MNTIYPLFVYGSLRKGFEETHFHYISQYFTFEGMGKIKGSLHDLGSYPAAVPEGNGFITGEIYQVKDPATFGYAMAQLDDYEGVNPGEDEAPLYHRQLTQVNTPNGDIQAWVYWYNGSVSGMPVIESGDVLEYLKKKSMV